ncbi:hypothetical protein N7507_002165 [Penicillium longicatenatum]|nr:hypothetical protein N7507_002165 [Penicillium longicatenatum]
MGGKWASGHGAVIGSFFVYLAVRILLIIKYIYHQFNHVHYSHFDEPSQSSSCITSPNVGGPNALRLDGQDPKYGDFRDDLARDGYAVVKGGVSRERAVQYANDMYT